MCSTDPVSNLFVVIVAEKIVPIDLSLYVVCGIVVVVFEKH